MNFGEERGRAVVEGLMAPRYKPLVQPATRWLARRLLDSSAPLFFSSQVPGMKKTGGREGRRRSLKRKLSASAERQD